MTDLLHAGVHILTLGQYLQPTKNHHPVIDWIHPDQFAKYKEAGLAMGFRYVESGPLVRSSYHAEKHLFDF
jgi:lipoic acid synthetase